MPSAVAYRLVTATAGGVPIVANTVKTILMAIAPAGHGLAVCQFSVTFDGVTNSAAPALVEIVQSTQAAAGTSGTAPTITQARGRSTAGSAPTGGSNYSGEPSVLTAIWADFVPVFNGFVDISFTDGHELEIDSSAGTTKGIGIRVTTPAGAPNVNVRADLEVANL